MLVIWGKEEKHHEILRKKSICWDHIKEENSENISYCFPLSPAFPLFQNHSKLWFIEYFPLCNETLLHRVLGYPSQTESPFNIPAKHVYIMHSNTSFKLSRGLCICITSMGWNKRLSALPTDSAWLHWLTILKIGVLCGFVLCWYSFFNYSCYGLIS